MTAPKHTLTSLVTSTLPLVPSSQESRRTRAATQLLEASSESFSAATLEREARVSWDLFRVLVQRQTGSYPPSLPQQWKHALSCRMRLLMWEQQRCAKDASSAAECKKSEAALMYLLARVDAAALGGDGEPDLIRHAEALSELFEVSPQQRVADCIQLTGDTLYEALPAMERRLGAEYSLEAVGAVTDWLSSTAGATAPPPQLLMPALLTGPSRQLDKGLPPTTPLVTGTPNAADALLASWSVLFEHLVPKLATAWESSVSAYVAALQKDLATLSKARRSASERERADLQGVLAKAEKLLGPKFGEVKEEHDRYTERLAQADRRHSCIAALEHQLEMVSQLSLKHTTVLRSVAAAGQGMLAASRLYLQCGGCPAVSALPANEPRGLEDSYAQSDIDTDILVPTIVTPLLVGGSEYLVVSQEALYALRVVCSVPRVLSPFAHTNDAAVAHNPLPACLSPGTVGGPSTTKLFPVPSLEPPGVASMDECPLLTAALTTKTLLSARAEIVDAVSTCLLAAQACSVPPSRLQSDQGVGAHLTERLVPIGEVTHSVHSATFFVVRHYCLREPNIGEEDTPLAELRRALQPMYHLAAASLNPVNVPALFTSYVQAVRSAAERTCAAHAECIDHILGSVASIGGLDLVIRKRPDADAKPHKKGIGKWIWGGGGTAGDQPASTLLMSPTTEEATDYLGSIVASQAKRSNPSSCSPWLVEAPAPQSELIVRCGRVASQVRRWYAVGEPATASTPDLEELAGCCTALRAQIGRKYSSASHSRVVFASSGVEAKWAALRVREGLCGRPAVVLNRPPTPAPIPPCSPVRPEGTVLVPSEAISRSTSPSGHDLLVALLTSAPGAISSLSSHLSPADFFVLALCSLAVPMLTTTVPLSSFTRSTSTSPEALVGGRRYAAPILFPCGGSSSTATAPSLPVLIEPHPVVVAAMQAPGGVPQSGLVSGLAQATKRAQAGTLKGFLSCVEGSVGAPRSVAQVVANADEGPRTAARFNVHGVFAAFASGAALAPPFIVPGTACAGLEPSLYSFAPVPAAQLSLPNFPGSEWHPGGVSSTTTTTAQPSPSGAVPLNLIELVLRAYFPDFRDGRGVAERAQQASCPSTSAALSEILAAAFPTSKHSEAMALCAAAISSLASGVAVLCSSVSSIWPPLIFPSPQTTRLRALAAACEAVLQQERPATCVSDVATVAAFTSIQSLYSVFSYPMGSSTVAVHRAVERADAALLTSSLLLEDPFAFAVGLLTPGWFVQARSALSLVSSMVLTALTVGPSPSCPPTAAPMFMDSGSGLGVGQLGAVAVAQLPRMDATDSSAHGNMGLLLACQSLAAHRRGSLLAGSLLSAEDGEEASGIPVAVAGSWRFLRAAAPMQTVAFRNELEVIANLACLLRRSKGADPPVVPADLESLDTPHLPTPNAHLGVLEPHLFSNVFAAAWSLPHRARNESSAYGLVLDTLRCCLSHYHLFALRQLPLSTVVSTLFPPCATLISTHATASCLMGVSAGVSTSSLDTELEPLLSGAATSPLRVLTNPVSLFEASVRQCAAPSVELLPAAALPSSSHVLRARPGRREQLLVLLQSPSWLVGVGVVGEHWARRLLLPFIPESDLGTPLSTLLRGVSEALGSEESSAFALRCFHCSPAVLAEGRPRMIGVMSALRKAVLDAAAQRGMQPTKLPPPVHSSYAPAAALRFLISNATAVLSMAAPWPGSSQPDTDPRQQAMLFAFRTVATLENHVQTLSHALHLLVNGGPIFRRAAVTKTVTVRHALFPLIVHAALRDEPELYRTAVTLFLTMRRQLGGEVSLVMETGSFFEHVVFFELSKAGRLDPSAPLPTDPSDVAYAVLNGPRVSYPMVCKMRLMLQFITALCEEPRNLVEIFVHFDCDPARPDNLLERILRTLSRLTTGSESPALPPNLRSRPGDAKRHSRHVANSTLLRDTDIVGAGITGTFLAAEASSTTAEEVSLSVSPLLVPFGSGDPVALPLDDMRERFTPFTHGELYEEALTALLTLPSAVTQWIERFQTEATAVVTRGVHSTQSPAEGEEEGWSSSEEDDATEGHGDEQAEQHLNSSRRRMSVLAGALEKRRIKKYFSKFFSKFNVSKDPAGAMALLDPVFEELRMMVSTAAELDATGSGLLEACEEVIEGQIRTAADAHRISLAAVFGTEERAAAALTTPLEEGEEAEVPTEAVAPEDEDALPDLHVALPAFAQRRAAHRCARFLHAHADSIDKLLLGEYFSKMKRKPFIRGVFQYWTELHPFAGMTVDEALRLLLGGFKLLGEAQVVDATMGIFATAYASHQPPAPQGTADESTAPFTFTRDTVFVLAFSICMLNTDAHSPHIPTKMSADEFVRNNRGIANGGDVPEATMRAIFANVSASEIKLRPTPFLPEGSPQRMSDTGAPASGTTGGSTAATSRIPLLSLLSPVAGMVSTAIKLPMAAAETLVGRRDKSISEPERQSQMRKARQQVQKALAAALADINKASVSSEAASEAAEALRSAGLEHAIPMWELCADRVAVAIGAALSCICRGDTLGSALRYKRDTTAAAYVGNKHALQRIGGNVVNMVGAVATILVRNPLTNTLGSAAAGVLAFAFGGDDVGGSGFTWHEKQDVEGGSIPLEQYVLAAATKYSRACAVLGYTGHLVAVCDVLQVLACVSPGILVVPNLAANVRCITTGEARAATHDSYPLCAEEEQRREERIAEECAAAKTLMGSTDAKKGVCDAYTSVAQSWIPLRRLRCAVGFIECVAAAGFAAGDVEGSQLYEAAFGVLSRLQVLTEDDPVWTAADNVLEMLAIGDASAGAAGKRAGRTSNNHPNSGGFPTDPIALIASTSQLLLSGGKKLLSTVTPGSGGGAMASFNVSNSTTLAEHVIASVSRVGGSQQTGIGRVFTALAGAVTSGGSSLFNTSVDIGAMLHTVRRIDEGVDGEEAMPMLVPSLGILQADRDAATAFLVSTLLVGALVSARPPEVGPPPPPSAFPTAPHTYITAAPQLLAHLADRGVFAVPAGAVAAALSLTPYQLVFSHQRLRAALKRNIERAAPSLADVVGRLSTLAGEDTLSASLDVQAMDAAQLPLVKGLAQEARREARHENRTQSLIRLADVLSGQLERHIVAFTTGVADSAASVAEPTLSGLDVVSRAWLRVLQQSSVGLSAWLGMFLSEALPPLLEVLGFDSQAGSGVQGFTLDGAEYSDILFVPARDVVTAAYQRCLIPLLQKVLGFTQLLRRSLQGWMLTASDVAVLRVFPRAAKDAEVVPEVVESRLCRHLRFVRHTAATLLASLHHIDDVIVSSCFGVDVPEGGDSPPTLRVPCEGAIAFTVAAGVEAAFQLSRWLATNTATLAGEPSLAVGGDWRLVVGTDDSGAPSVFSYGTNNVAAARARVTAALLGGLSQEGRDVVQSVVQRVLSDGSTLVLPCPSVVEWSEHVGECVASTSDFRPHRCLAGGAWGSILRYFHALGGSADVPLAVRSAAWEGFRSVLLSPLVLDSMSGDGDFVEGASVCVRTPRPLVAYRSLLCWVGLCMALRAFALTPKDNVALVADKAPEKVVVVVSLDGSGPNAGPKLSILERIRCEAAFALTRALRGIPADAASPVTEDLLNGLSSGTRSAAATPKPTTSLCPTAAQNITQLLVGLVMPAVAPVNLPALSPASHLAWYALAVAATVVRRLPPQASAATLLNAVAVFCSLIAPDETGRGTLLFGPSTLAGTFGVLGSVQSSLLPSDEVVVYSTGQDKTPGFERSMGRDEVSGYLLSRGVAIAVLALSPPTPRLCAALMSFLAGALSSPTSRAGECLTTIVASHVYPAIQQRSGYSGVVLQEAVVRSLLQPIPMPVVDALPSFAPAEGWGAVGAGPALVPLLQEGLLRILQGRPAEADTTTPGHLVLAAIEYIRLLVELLPDGRDEPEAAVLAAARACARRSTNDASLGVVMLPVTYLLIHKRHQVSATAFPFWEWLAEDVLWSHSALTQARESGSTAQAMYVSLCTVLRWCLTATPAASPPPAMAMLSVLVALPSEWDERVLHGFAIVNKRRGAEGYFASFPSLNLTYRYLQQLKQLPPWDGRDITLGRLASGASCIPAALESLTDCAIPEAAAPLLQLVQAALRAHFTNSHT